MFQVIAMAVLASATVFASPLIIVPCLALYVWSTWWYGRAI
jgi:hypothetical protein